MVEHASHTASSIRTIMDHVPDYKSAKEAFVADNPGASILTINAVSLAALVSPFLKSCRHLYTLTGRFHFV